MAATDIVVGVLNVIAHPHPPGVYVRILTAVARQPVRFWGDEHAATTAPEDAGNGLYRGQILIWTEVDPDLPAINKTTLEEADLDQAAAQFTRRYGVNLKVFTYVLRARDHRVFFEVVNDAGKRLSPARAAKIFGTLLAPPHLDPDSDPVVEVLVQPSEDALTQVLAIHRLTHLMIDIPRPNADDLSQRAQGIMDEITEQNGSRYQKALVVERGQSVNRRWKGTPDRRAKGTPLSVRREARRPDRRGSGQGGAAGRVGALRMVRRGF